MNGPRFLINGQLSSQVSVLDRGLHYGDGLFETIAVNKGVPLLWHAHMQRLQNGCQSLKILLPKPQTLLNEVKQLCADKHKAIIKILITRGEGGRAYKAPSPVETNRIVAVYDWPEYPQGLRSEGVSIRLCDSRIGLNPSLAGIKHLNRLEQVLARNEWDDDSIFEGLLLDMEDNIIEGTMSNLFIIKGKKILTPDLSQSGVKGIIRDVILKLSPDFGLQGEVKKLSLTDVLAADEIFLTNSVIGLVPVKHIEGKCFDSFKQTHKISAHLLNENLIASL